MEMLRCSQIIDFLLDKSVMLATAPSVNCLPAEGLGLIFNYNTSNVFAIGIYFVLVRHAASLKIKVAI